MGARTGQDYIDRLAQSNPHVQINGDTVTGNLHEHPALRGVMRSYADLYDLQHAPGTRDVLTYEEDGERFGTSFLVPRSHADLVRRREGYKAWADHSLGTMGRTGDYMNASLMALSEAGPWFAQADQRFADNVKAYFEKVKNEDLLLTHTLIPPQVNRSAGAAQEVNGRALSAHVVREDDNGIVVRGARMLATIGPIADELLVFPSTVLKGTAEDDPYSFAFAVPCDAPGLRFVCREGFDQGASHYDHPLGSRFDEVDAVVVFDDVHVPWERVFLLGHAELSNSFYSDTSAAHHMTHQVTTRTTAKTEAILGIVSLLTEAIGIERFGHVQEDIASTIVTLETVRGLVRAAEADAVPNAYGVYTPRWEPLNAARNWYPRIYGKFPEMLRKLGASGLMALPTERDVYGAGEEDIATYLQSATLSGAERVRLFRLAWDLSASAFAGRQTLYEYYFFGDPVRMSAALVSSYDRAPYKDRVQAFLERSDLPQAV